jgi:hypothetical protein
MSFRKFAKNLKLTIFKEDTKNIENIDDKKIETKDLSPILDSYYEQIYNSTDILGFRTLNISSGTTKKQK